MFVSTRTLSRRWSLLALALLGSFPLLASGQNTLSQRIDQMIAASIPELAKKAAPPASDAEFLRRVTLDLTGTIPTTSETRAFLTDRSPGKRQRLIERLLASPEFARHQATLLDVMLMERRPDKHVPRAAWQEYLYQALAQNRPWDALARELLSTDGSDPKNRVAAKFFLEREAEPNLVTRDIARLFLGMNLQCAQCHDHPIVPDYKQDQYYGIYAFLTRVSLFSDPKSKTTMLAEKAEGEATFQSVFDKTKTTRTTGPRVPGRPLLKEPKLTKDAEYKVKPAKNVRPVPAFSRLALLGSEIARPDNVPFQRNFANRLWAQMMGRGLVHPLDMDHTDNPPAHPALLTMLAQEAVTQKFDIRHFLHDLALTQTYQRSSELPSGMQEPAPFLVAQLKPLLPEELAASLYQATGMTDIERTALGKKVAEATLHARVSAATAPLVNVFRSEAGTPEDFQPTLDQALQLTNGNLLRSWLNPRTGNLIDRLTKLKDAGALADEMYLSILTRYPTADERQDLANYLQKPGKDRVAACQDYAWALLTSAEFRFNH